MTERKTPILLRRGPMSGTVQAIYQYRKIQRNGHEMIDASGKQDIQADFDALVLEELIPDHKSGIAAALDGAAKGMELDETEREEIRDFRERLVTIIERFNTQGHGAQSPSEGEN